MRILALYDIHGNIDALNAVLADPGAQDPDLIIVGGDAVPGAFCREVIDRLAALDVPSEWVRGNGEREVAQVAATKHATEPDATDTPTVTAHRTAERLGRTQALTLGDLPLTLVRDGVLFCHATPRRDDEIVTRISNPERLVQALRDVDAPLVVGGHTHQQDDRTVGGTRFVNAGSVGMPYEGDGAARWLWLQDGEPGLRSTAYDSRAAGDRILESGWPDRDSIMAALIEPMPAIEITRLFEQAASGGD